MWVLYIPFDFTNERKMKKARLLNLQPSDPMILIEMRSWLTASVILQKPLQVGGLAGVCTCVLLRCKPELFATELTEQQLLQISNQVLSTALSQPQYFCILFRSQVQPIKQ